MHTLLDVVADAELRDKFTILDDVVLLDVRQKTTTMADDHEQAAAGVEVLRMGLHVLSELADALRGDGNLNLGVAGVLRVLAELSGELRLALLRYGHGFTFLSIRQGLGRSSVIRPTKSKARLRYGTTTRPHPRNLHIPPMSQKGTGTFWDIMRAAT